YDRTHLLPMLGGAAWLGQEPLAAQNDRAMKLTAWTIGELARRVRADGGCLIVAWQPIAGVPNGARTPPEAGAGAQISARAPTRPMLAPAMFAELRQATQPLVASGAAVEVDATAAFDGEEKQVYQEDGVHYTALGNRLVAAAIQPALSQRSCS